MIEETARGFATVAASAVPRRCRRRPGAAARRGSATPTSLFAQVSFSLDDAPRLARAVDFDGPVYAGVMVRRRAPRWPASSAPRSRSSPCPTEVVDRVERDRGAGVELACELVAASATRGAFDGVHLIPVSRYREVVRRLETMGLFEPGR